MNYQTQKVMFSSMDSGWRTPQDLFDQLDREFHFDTDVCADSKHPLKEIHQEPPFRNFYGNSGLSMLSWKRDDGECMAYMNPPYGREIVKWVSKAWLEAKINGVITVALLPCRTDTYWFWTYCINQEIRLIRGRVRFLNDDKDDLPAPFPSMIVVYRP